MSIYNKVRRAVAKRIVNRKLPLNLSEAIVTFTFDDVPDSGMEEGMRILNTFGYKGTYYVALSFYDHNRTDGMQFNPKYLKQVVDGGGELACHTYNHIHFYQSGKAQIREDLDKNRQRMQECIDGLSFTNFSYPYGEQTITAKQVVKNRFKTARGVNSGINHGVIDLINLRAYQLGEQMRMQDVYNLIDEAIRLKGWLIFFTHDVENKPSIYGCTPAMLEGAAAYCKEKQVKVLTMDQAANAIGAR
ncbi:MAG: polysaccharide deacetylase family protein [Flavobacteriales bacterium]|nr:polysaccharide deacetylase family protein [Flavobacteriales bacterium]